ncbi:hypothetical protein, partial [Roseobacter sinensis]
EENKGNLRRKKKEVQKTRIDRLENRIGSFQNSWCSDKSARGLNAFVRIHILVLLRSGRIRDQCTARSGSDPEAREGSRSNIAPDTVLQAAVNIFL